MHNHEGSDPNCPNCRVGAFSAGDARPPMPMGQVMPAGQAWGNPNGPQTVGNGGDLSLAVACGLHSGVYAGWLVHNGWSCQHWSSLTTDQQLQFLRGTFIGGDYSWTAKGKDQYNATFSQAIGCFFQSLSRYRIGVGSFWPDWGVGGGGATRATQAPSTQFSTTSIQETQLRQLLNAINADCLRNAIQATNAPQPTGIVQRTMGVKAAGESVMPAGQGGQGGRTHDLSDFKSLSIGRPRVVVATAPNVNPATVLSQLGNVTCAQWTALPATEKTRLMTWWLTTYAPSSGIAYSTASIYAQIIRMGQYCNAVANQNSQTVPNIQNVRPSGYTMLSPNNAWFHGR